MPSSLSPWKTAHVSTSLASAGFVRFGDEYGGLPGLPFVIKGQPPFAVFTSLSDDLVNALLLDMLAGLSSHHGCQDVLHSNPIILSACNYISCLFTFI